jgi:hypothetical protein
LTYTKKTHNSTRTDINLNRRVAQTSELLQNALLDLKQSGWFRLLQRQTRQRDQQIVVIIICVQDVYSGCKDTIERINSCYAVAVEDVNPYLQHLHQEEDDVVVDPVVGFGYVGDANGARLVVGERLGTDILYMLHRVQMGNSTQSWRRLFRTEEETDDGVKEA